MIKPLTGMICSVFFTKAPKPSCKSCGWGHTDCTLLLVLVRGLVTVLTDAMAAGLILAVLHPYEPQHACASESLSSHGLQHSPLPAVLFAFPMSVPPLPACAWLMLLARGAILCCKCLPEQPHLKWRHPVRRHAARRHPQGMQRPVDLEFDAAPRCFPLPHLRRPPLCAPVCTLLHARQASTATYPFLPAGASAASLANAAG